MVERGRLAILAALSGFPLGLQALAVAVTQPATPAAVARMPARFVEYDRFPSRIVAPRKVLVWLPPDYDRSTEPCSVLYMHDGQNLFAPANPFGNGPWDVDKQLITLAGLGKVRRTLVVGIWNTGLNRSREYMPAAAIERLPTALQWLLPESSADNYHYPLADQYLRFLADELKPFIDRNFRTRAEPAETFVMGSSKGGLISLYALATRPDLFGAAACLSTHWPLTTNPALPPATDPRVAQAATAFLDWLAERLPAAGSHRLYFDHGSLGLDALYAPYQNRMDALAAGKGYRDGGDYLSRVFAGADHNERAWRRRLAVPLQFLLPPRA